MSIDMVRTILWAVVITGAAGCGQDLRDVAVRVSADPGTRQITRSFTTRYDGSYAISLEFSWPIEDPTLSAIVNVAAASAGSPVASTEFDFAWQIVQGSQTVAQGSGRDGVTGVMDGSAGGLGGGPLKSRTLKFGRFSARKGEQYALHVSTGSAFEKISKGHPVLQVEREPPF